MRPKTDVTGVVGGGQLPKGVAMLKISGNRRDAQHVIGVGHHASDLGAAA